MDVNHEEADYRELYLTIKTAFKALQAKASRAQAKYEADLRALTEQKAAVSGQLEAVAQSVHQNSLHATLMRAQIAAYENRCVSLTSQIAALNHELAGFRAAVDVANATFPNGVGVAWR